jgi:hypothetical protein
LWQHPVIRSLPYYSNLLSFKNFSSIITTDVESTIHKEGAEAYHFIKNFVPTKSYDIITASKVLINPPKSVRIVNYRVTTDKVNFSLSTTHPTPKDVLIAMKTKTFNEVTLKEFMNWVNLGKIYTPSVMLTSNVLSTISKYSISNIKSLDSMLYDMQHIKNLESKILSNGNLIVLGRKGAGKSAISKMLSEKSVFIVDSDDYGDAQEPSMEAILSAVITIMNVHRCSNAKATHALNVLCLGGKLTFSDLTDEPFKRKIDYKTDIEKRYIKIGIDTNSDPYLSESKLILELIEKLHSDNLQVQQYMKFLADALKENSLPTVVFVHTESEMIGVRQVLRSAATIKVNPGIPPTDDFLDSREKPFQPYQRFISTMYNLDMIYDSMSPSQILSSVPITWLQY